MPDRSTPTAQSGPPDLLLARHGVILFDGVCNLCNGTVNFVIDHDPRGYFKLASLQSEVGQGLLRRFGVQGEAPDSIILIEGGRVYYRSTAALRIARRLSGAWPLLYVFMLIPRPLRDRIYDWVARNRYRWFGKSETCRLPTPELRERFLEQDTGKGAGEGDRQGAGTAEAMGTP